MNYSQDGNINSSARYGDKYKRETVISDLKSATYFLHNYTVTLSVCRKEPTY